MKTVVNTSTRSQQSIVTVEENSTPTAPMSKGEYLAAILAGYPGQGVKIEPAYSEIPRGCLGSRAQGIFLN